MIRQLGEQDMLGPDTQLIHALYTTEQERATVRETGASVSISPWSELLIGYGVTPVLEMEQSGMLLTLSVDTLPLTGTADLWSVARLDDRAAARPGGAGARREHPADPGDGDHRRGPQPRARRRRRLAHPGKRADLILVRTRDIATAPRTDVPNLLALAAGAENVDTVMVDGRIRKRHGELVDIDEARVVRETEAALRALLAR